MSAWRKRLLLLALLVVGCGSDEESGGVGIAPGDPFGGQTGSLAPRSCGISRDDSDAVVIPSGENAFIVQAEGCADLSPADVEVTGPDGQPVPIELVPLEDGQYLARAPSTLGAGQYAVSVEGAPSVDLQVSGTSPLPTALGVLRVTNQYWCGANFALELDEETLPYVALMRLRASLDGGPEEVWIDYGLIAPEGGEVALGMDCGCLRSRYHELVLRADIAGEPTEPEPVFLDFEVDCASGGDDRRSSCALPARAPRFAADSAVLFGLMSLGWLARRRRAATKVSTR